MDWRLIAALGSAGGSLCLVAVGAYAVMTANPAQPRKYAPPPSLLSANKAGTSGVGAPLASLTPAAPPSPFAPSPLAISSPAVTPGPAAPNALTRPSAAAPSTLARPSAAVTPSPFAPTTLDPPGPALAPSPFAPSPFAPVANLDLAPSPVGPPIAVGAGPSIDLRRVSDHEPHKPQLLSTEARREHQPPHRLAALTPPPDAVPRQEPPPRPVVELKRPTMVPEIHTALPTARYQGVLTFAEIIRIKQNLRLSPDQEPKWPAVEAALGEMGRQQILLIRHGQEPRISPNDWPTQRLYSIAGPLLMSLRPDQKDQVRRLCRSLGFESVASML